jgi:hypothetical protein
VTRSGEIGPWRRLDARVLAGGHAVGAGLLLIGWFGASASVSVRHQLLWVNVAAVGAIFGGGANALWLLSARRVIASAQSRIDAAVRGADHVSVAAAAEVELVAADAMRRYHRSTCPLVAGKAVVGAGRDQHEASGRRPCGVCGP